MGFVILIGCVALLMYGMKVMSEGLQKMAGGTLRTLLGKATTNRFTGLLTGAFITTSIQSSTATTVMTVSFVSAGLLTLAQAISVIMGANIGTTATAWIMVLGGSFDMRLVVYGCIVAAIILIYSKKNINMGEFLMGLSLMLLGLTTLKTNAVDMHLDQNEAIKGFFDSTCGLGPGDYGTYFLYLLIGGLLTCAVQSSAAIMAITMTLCSTGVLDIYSGIALVMGENIGTTITSNVVALSASTQAQRAARAHLVFNLFGVVWVLCIFKLFVNFVCGLVGVDPTNVDDPMKLNAVLAAFHTTFNVCNVLILIWFINPMEKLVRMLVADKPEGEEEMRLKFITGGLLSTSELSILEARKEIGLFAERTQRMFGMVGELLHIEKDEDFNKTFSRIEKYEGISDSMELEIAQYLNEVSEGRLSIESKRKIQGMLREVSEIESIGDSCYNLARSLRRHRQNVKEKFTKEQIGHIEQMMKLSNEALTEMVRVLNYDEYRRPDLNKNYNIEHEINNYRTQLKAQNVVDINDQLYSYQIGVYYSDIISECERLGDYVINVIDAYAGIKREEEKKNNNIYTN